MSTTTHNDTADYRRACRAEPRLALVESVARTHDFDCSGCAWELDLKARVTPLVGWERADRTDPWLCSMDAYRAVVDHIVTLAAARVRGRQHTARKGA
ncbi:hypothetical protein ATM97_16980 [Nocardia sp. MH4]|uniref:hypothetical protein n=1 Tax=Nocardia sp. MH4 TaxID=1768677 RepID=UPI001C4EFE40|nr:hypothetical protein [Nocardia sp. MH4]MBW0274303.1 hypothetical protein [Nocardia sp. MH4]